MYNEKLWKQKVCRGFNTTSRQLVVLRLAEGPAPSRFCRPLKPGKNDTLLFSTISLSLWQNCGKTEEDCPFQKKQSTAAGQKHSNEGSAPKVQKATARMPEASRAGALPVGLQRAPCHEVSWLWCHRGHLHLPRASGCPGSVGAAWAHPSPTSLLQDTALSSC